MIDLEDEIIGQLGKVTVGDVRKAIEGVADDVILNADFMDNLCFDMAMTRGRRK